MERKLIKCGISIERNDSAMKRSEALIHAMAGITPDHIRLRERNQTQKATNVAWFQIPMSRMDKPTKTDESRRVLASS